MGVVTAGSATGEAAAPMALPASGAGDGAAAPVEAPAPLSAPAPSAPRAVDALRHSSGRGPASPRVRMASRPGGHDTERSTDTRRTRTEVCRRADVPASEYSASRETLNSSGTAEGESARTFMNAASTDRRFSAMATSEQKAPMARSSAASKRM